MIRLNNKPRVTSFKVGGFSCFKYNNAWHTLHLDGIGYKGFLVDGRSVFGSAKSSDKIQEYKTF